MLCDLAAWPAFFPFGALYYGMYEWLNQSYIFGRTVATFRDPWLIIPTVITNAGLYYFVGYAIGVGFGGRRLILGKLISLRAFLLLLLLGVVVPPLVWVLVTALR